MAKKRISPEAQAIMSAADAGLYATTVALVERFLETHPDSLRGWLDLGQSLGQLARYDEAEKAFLKVIELSGDGPCGAVYGEIGNLYRSKGDFGSAISWYQKQIDAEPAEAVGYLYLGNILMRQGDFEAAEAAFQASLACDDVCLEEAHFSLGLVNRSLGRLNQAKTYFEKAVELNSQFTQARLALKDVK
jgi:tetratricopeptide (TPR) repeat protein